MSVPNVKIQSKPSLLFYQNTNVVKFYSLLQKDATEEQMCYYQVNIPLDLSVTTGTSTKFRLLQPGVGTYLQPGVVSPLFQWCAKIADEAVAWSV